MGDVWINNLETASGKRLDDPKHPDHKKPYVQDYIREFGVRKREANALVWSTRKPVADWCARRSGAMSMPMRQPITRSGWSLSVSNCGRY